MIPDATSIFGGVNASANANAGANANANANAGTGAVDQMVAENSITPDGHPRITSTGSAVEADATMQTQKSVNEIEEDKQHAVDQFGTFKQAQYDTPGTDLNEHQNVNFAEGDTGPYARGNRRSYDQTLRLSREADAYNNRPTEQVRDWTPGGSTSIGNVSYVNPYNRPNIETEEMREMQKSRQLDLNQKQLAQQLQAAVNQKNLDAFKNYWQQMYGITITAFEAEQQMRVFNRQQHIYNTIMKDKSSYEKYLKLHFDQVTANTIFRVSMKNPAVGMYLAPLSLGYPMASFDDSIVALIQQAVYSDALEANGGDVASAGQTAYSILRDMGLGQANEDIRAIKNNK